MSKQLQLPHAKFMQDHKIDVADEKQEILSPATRRALENIAKLEDAYPKIKDETQKNQATELLKEKSEKVLELLQADVDKAKEKADAKADEDAAERERKKTEKEARKASGKPNDTDDDDEPGKNKKDPAGTKSAAAGSKSNPYGLTDSQIEVKKIIDDLWNKKSKTGQLETTEKELVEIGANPWSGSGLNLGMFTGKLGPYNFKSSGSEVWVVTKE